MLAPSTQVAVAVALGVVCAGVGLALVFDAARRILFQRRARRSFERVDAVVADAALHEPADGGPHAIPHVEYEYDVDGESYTSRRLWPTRTLSPDPVDREVALRVVEDHQAGAQVVAYYDPEEPSTAFLLPEFDHTGERRELAVGLAMLVVAAVGVALLVGGAPPG
jgi:hypothetical protein